MRTCAQDPVDVLEAVEERVGAHRLELRGFLDDLVGLDHVALLISFQPATITPHSKPFVTSLTSSLKRRSEPILPS